jgi:hypothetical protein
MAMDFEDTLSESQADIVSLCLEYVGEEETIYTHTVPSKRVFIHLMFFMAQTDLFTTSTT